jgi:hypothetical protein
LNPSKKLEQQSSSEFTLKRLSASSELKTSSFNDDEESLSGNF